ncbi:olfactory receptor 12D1-like [Tiliqua scincoides]|uniref:olfactory receptor 12D1-like n=1 Tax=Tiliqua scincoides TaxID=71010 RepID=UPI0034633FD8
MASPVLENQTEVQEFILLGLTNDRKQQHILFTIFLLLYVACLLGNGTILAIVVAEPRLHTPMYFFLGNLSCLDICYSTVTMPKMLHGFLIEHQTISFIGCMTQLHFFHFLGGTEAMLLGVMAYDRYVAICNPLRYTVIMSKWACLSLAVATWSAGFIYSLMYSVMTSRAWFCGPNHILHFFCDIKPLLKLACSSTTFNLTLLNIVSGCVVMATSFVTLFSYLYIVTFLFFKFQMWQSLWKAFSTCASHLTVVMIFQTPVVFNYMLASAIDSSKRDMMITVLYSVVTPVLNPLIYSLRNQEVKSSVRKILSKKWLSGRT